MTSRVSHFHLFDNENLLGQHQKLYIIISNKHIEVLHIHTVSWIRPSSDVCLKWNQNYWILCEKWIDINVRKYFGIKRKFFKNLGRWKTWWRYIVTRRTKLKRRFKFLLLLLISLCNKIDKFERNSWHYKVIRTLII